MGLRLALDVRVDVVRLTLCVRAVSMRMRVGVRMRMRMPVSVRVPVPPNEKPRATHADANCFCCVAIIRPTAIAAPKPLSMFTTVMPEAQLVSMANSAVKPLNALP